MQRALPLSSPLRIFRHTNRLSFVILARPWPALMVLVVGTVLRALLLDRPGLHPDEALYASWALRIADGSDPALLGVYVDKPPLLLYLLAGLFRLAGFDGQAPLHPGRLLLAGRLAALLASSVSLALLWLIARRVHGPRVALGALALFALSPLAVRLSPTLFTDPWLALWLLLGLWAALGRRAWLAGIACGLAYATKQQGVLFAPLLLAVLWFSLRRDTCTCVRRKCASAPSVSMTGRELVGEMHPAAGVCETCKRGLTVRRQGWRWLNGFAIVAVAVLWWDSLRWQWMPSYWDRSAQTYGGVALALDALPERLAQWGELLGYGFGWPLWLAVAVLVLLALYSVSARRTAKRHAEHLASCHADRRRRSIPVPMGSLPRWFDALLLAYVAGYMLLHIATNLAPWDRYLLPLIPLLALLLARGVFWAWDAIAARPQPAGRVGWASTVAVAGLALGLLYTGYMASFARLPLGDGGAYDGVPQIAAHVRSAEPSDAILYHHWLGWHYNFYLYGAPVELRWWQDPADLVHNAAANPGLRQLIAFPAGREQEGVRAALAAAGLQLSPVLAVADASGAPSATLYSIEPTLAGATAHGR